MLGSEASVANPNIILNTAVAECVHQFAEQLKDVPDDKMDDAIHELIRKTITDHKRVIFNGNGYTDEWIEEAEKRGLYNLKSTPEALPQFIAEKNVDLFLKHHIFTKEEIHSRYEILLENYVKTIQLESKTMQEMLSKDFLPAVSRFAGEVSRSVLDKKALLPSIKAEKELALVESLTTAYETLSEGNDKLKALTEEVSSMESMQEAATFCHDKVLALMDELRVVADEAETRIPEKELPYPTYDQLLFSV